MARVDYWALLDQIRTILQGDATLSGTTVVVEDQLILAEAGPVVGIYLERRDAPVQYQTLRAGQSTRYLVRVALWCWDYSLASVEDAMHKRDDLLGKVEVSLMNNRTLSGKVNTLWLEGGQMPSGRIPEQSGFISGGEVVAILDIKATTV